MPNAKEIKREANSVTTIQSVSSQMNGGVASAGSDGGAIDWKRKYEEEFDKRCANEEQYDNLQAQVFIILLKQCSMDGPDYIF